MPPKLILITAVILFMGTQRLYSQSVSSTWNLLIDYVNEDNSVTDDSIFVAGVKTLFGLSRQPVTEVLADARDTSFYQSLKNIICDDTTRLEFVLFRAEKRTDISNLKCMVDRRYPELGITDVIAWVNLPFVLHGDTLKFKNYFTENRKDFISDGQHKVYTTLQNKKNLSRINDYINGLSEKFSLPIDSTGRLFYTYYSANESAYAALGLEFYLYDIAGRHERLSNSDFIIFDKLGGGFFKHELAHYVVHKRIKSKFFNEGFATYNGGDWPDCDRDCCYRKLLSLLEKQTNDSVFMFILTERYTKDLIYGNYTYSLGALTVQLMIEKYGHGFFNNEELQHILDSNSPREIDTFLSEKLNMSKLSLREYCVQKLREYLGNTGKIR